MHVLFITIVKIEEDRQPSSSIGRLLGPKDSKEILRSTPCPAAKTVDEWLDPELCEAGDNCQYCHTRTEQQFHPEIYKSTKCNDMLEVNIVTSGV